MSVFTAVLHWIQPKLFLSIPQFHSPFTEDTVEWHTLIYTDVSVALLSLQVHNRKLYKPLHFPFLPSKLRPQHLLHLIT